MQHLTQLLQSGYVKDVKRNPNKCFLLGWMLTQYEDTQEAMRLVVRLYTHAATKGHVQAKFNLAKMYELGVGVSANPSKSLELLREAADADCAKAWAALGWAFGHGEMVELDADKSETCYEQAIMRGHIPSATNLAYLYLFGAKASEKETKLLQIIGHLEEAARDDHAGAFYILGRMYESGIGGSVDIQKAIGYYEKGAKLGHGASVRQLITLYICDDTCRDPEKAEIYQQQLASAPLPEERTPLQTLRFLQAGYVVGDYEFKDTGLFIVAMLRPSAIRHSLIGPEITEGLPKPEHLEFVGDRILNQAIAKRLAELYPSRERSSISFLYQKFTRNADTGHRSGSALYRVAKVLNIKSVLLMHESDSFLTIKKRGPHPKKKSVEAQLANHVEMLLGAIAKDRGDEAAQQFVLRHWAPMGLNPEGGSDNEYGLSDSEQPCCATP